MTRRIVFGLAGLGLLLAVGIAFARSRGAQIPGLPPLPLAAALDGPARRGDSLEVATFAHNRCRLVRGKSQQACYEEILLALVERGQVRLAMDALSVLGRLDPGTVARGHDLTHVVGINGWKPGLDVGAVYQSCTGLYQSGCYHGVVQAYLDANGTDSSTVASVCNLIKAATTNMWLRFQCVHGIGHGLVQNTSLHLPKALAGCDWLVDGWDANSCYGGAFMEFIVAGRGQSHHPHGKTAAAKPTDHGDDHAHHEPADSFPIRDPNDPLFPCSVVGPKYQASCYGMLAGIVIENTGADFGKIAKACDQAPPGLRPSCYQGIGTYVSGFTVRDPAKSEGHCNRGHPDYKAWCFVGVVKNFIDVTAVPKDGLDFCTRVHDQPAVATACYVAVGEQIAVLFPMVEDRTRECAKADPVGLAACRYGAALTSE
ncbi:MAG: hypothetical protein FJ206_05470 [Gemmatimonadetes bacterium]|nr:hypothetical protein [Gemmatimonadota bacterium]